MNRLIYKNWRINALMERNKLIPSFCLLKDFQKSGFYHVFSSVVVIVKEDVLRSIRLSTKHSFAAIVVLEYLV